MSSWTWHLPYLEPDTVGIGDEFLTSGPACLLTAEAHKENAECVQPGHSGGCIGSSQWKRQVAWLLAKPSRQVDDYRPSRWIFNNLNEQRALGLTCCTRQTETLQEKRYRQKRTSFWDSVLTGFSLPFLSHVFLRFCGTYVDHGIIK
jgi:hypothetical protein